VYTDAYDPNYEMLPGAPNPYAKVREWLNVSGFRGPDLPSQKQPGVYRIISAGDSTTFGANVNEDQTYSAVLKKLLHDRGVQVEVLNAGIPGTSIWQQVTLIKRKLLPRYQPDLIILYTGPSFRPDVYLLQETRRGRASLWQTQRVLAHFHLYRLLRLWLRPPRFADLLNQYNLDAHGVVPWDKVRLQVREDLLELRALGQKYGCRLLVVPRMTKAEYDDARQKNLHANSADWRSFARRENPVYQMAEVLAELHMDHFIAADDFLEASYHIPLFLDAVHFTPAGHELMARLLANQLCAGDWLPRACAAR
jgi:lysophospholipase L1-like esterase